MSGPGFWAAGHDEFRRGVEQRLAVLQKRLDDSRSEPDRARIAAEIEEARQALTKSEDGRILW